MTNKKNNPVFDKLFHTSTKTEESSSNSDEMPVVSVHGMVQQPDNNLQEEPVPDDYTDHQTSFQKPDEVKSEQEKEDEAMEEAGAVSLFDVLQKRAYVAYETGLMSLYMALAWAYIWKYFVDKDELYKAEVFKDEADQENSHEFTKAIKICFKIDAKQKSTISMYKDCLVFLDEELPDTVKCGITYEEDDKYAEKIAMFIKNNGGIKKCANKGKVKGDEGFGGGKETISKNDYKRAKEDYLSSQNIAGSLSNNGFEKYSESDLVIMVARKVKGKTDEFEVVDVITDDNLLNQIIKFNKQS